MFEKIHIYQPVNGIHIAEFVQVPHTNIRRVYSECESVTIISLM